MRPAAGPLGARISAAGEGAGAGAAAASRAAGEAGAAATAGAASHSASVASASPRVERFLAQAKAGCCHRLRVAAGVRERIADAAIAVQTAAPGAVVPAAQEHRIAGRGQAGRHRPGKAPALEIREVELPEVAPAGEGDAGLAVAAGVVVVDRRGAARAAAATARAAIPRAGRFS